MKISLLVPTRERPNNMLRMWKSAKRTATNPDNLEIVFYIDFDDQKALEVYNLLESNQTKLFLGPRLLEGATDMWNKAYSLATGEILMLAADDIVFRTTNWDEKIINSFLEVEDKILYSWAYDGNKRKKLGTHGFVHRTWVEIIGYFAPIVPFYGVDVWFTSLGNTINRCKYFDKDEIFIEHVHYALGKVKVDSTYKFRQQSGSYKSHFKTIENEYNLAIKKLKQAMKEIK